MEAIGVGDDIAGARPNGESECVKESKSAEKETSKLMMKAENGKRDKVGRKLGLKLVMAVSTCHPLTSNKLGDTETVKSQGDRSDQIWKEHRGSTVAVYDRRQVAQDSWTRN